jgi:carboxyl-terminal processing protease
MQKELFSAVIVALLAAPGLEPAFGAEQPKAAPESTDVAARVLTISDVVLERHIDPPARQQMLLAGVKALYRADNQPAQSGLSRRISQLAGEDEIKAYLEDVLRQFDKLASAEAIVTAGMLEAVPGGANLIAAEMNRIDEQLRANRYVGIGIVLAMSKDKVPQIPKAFYEGPAWKAGVKAGDLILEIDSRPTASKPLQKIIEELRGEEGSELTIVVRQPDSQESRTLTLTRSPVFIPTVEGVREQEDGQWQYTLDAAGDIALLRIKSIGPSTLHELRKLEALLHRAGVRGVILDVRSGGGTLHEIVLVADALLEEGVIGHVRGADKQETFEARPGSLFPGLPLAVLVGRATSSGQVFLTAALQDHGRATVVGEAPQSEIFVRSLVDIPGRGDKLVLPTAYLQRGDGTLLGADSRRAPVEIASSTEDANERPRRSGALMPDHVVSASAADSDQDAVLQKAVEVLKTALARAPEPKGDASPSKG